MNATATATTPAQETRRAKARHLATSSSETAARYHVAKHNGPRTIAPPAYATDGIATPRRKRWVLLDLAPHTVEVLLDAMRRVTPNDDLHRHDATTRLLVEALEKAR